MSKYFYNTNTDEYYVLTTLDIPYKYVEDGRDRQISHRKLNSEFYANNLENVEKSDTPFSQ